MMLMTCTGFMFRMNFQMEISILSYCWGLSLILERIFSTSSGLVMVNLLCGAYLQLTGPLELISISLSGMIGTAH